MNRAWIVDADHNVKEATFDEWLAWYLECRDPAVFERLCRVALTQIDGDCKVSTVFIGFGGGYFETLVFGAYFDGHGRRYATWEDAEAGHAAIVAKVMEGR